jgi:hypothetical protein
MERSWKVHFQTSVVKRRSARNSSLYPIARPPIIRPTRRVATLLAPACIAQPHSAIKLPILEVIDDPQVTEHLDGKKYLDGPFPSKLIIRPGRIYYISHKFSKGIIGILTKLHP